MGHTGTTEPIETFVRVDLMGALGGTLFVIVVNGVVVRVPAVWLVVPFLAALIGSLALALRMLPDRHLVALALVGFGNWSVALGVSALFPFLWPVMILAVLLPLVLATPYLDRRSIRLAATASALMAALVSAIGLITDDGGVVVDIDDTLEFLLVIGALGALTLPIGLVIGQNNALQRVAIDELAQSRRRIVEAGDQERSRIERDLHDGAQQRLLALGMRIRLLLGRGEPVEPEEIAALEHEVDAALRELRELAHGIYPPLLAARGLTETLASMARESLLDIETRLDPVGRAPAPVETALYFTAREALTNVAKHTGHECATRLELRHSGDRLELCIADAGPGFDPTTAQGSLGLTSMADRISAVDGHFRVESSPTGTVVTASVPITPPTAR